MGPKAARAWAEGPRLKARLLAEPIPLQIPLGAPLQGVPVSYTHLTLPTILRV